MSCPDWRALAAHRAQRDGVEPAGWAEALAHLPGCSDCRRSALAADPTLLFRRLGPTPPPDVAAILQGVRTLRRATPPRRSWAWLRHSAAAAALAILSLGLLPSAPSEKPAVAAREELEWLPIVETLDRPEARIYRLAAEDLDVVLIVDESLDV